eukprot:758913-Hanusia_phi.AAC.3
MPPPAARLFQCEDPLVTTRDQSPRCRLQDAGQTAWRVVKELFMINHHKPGEKLDYKTKT